MQKEKSVKALLTEPNYAIYCDQTCGPSFGKFDFVIQKNQGNQRSMLRKTYVF